MSNIHHKSLFVLFAGVAQSAAFKDLVQTCMHIDIYSYIVSFVSVLVCFFAHCVLFFQHFIHESLQIPISAYKEDVDLLKAKPPFIRLFGLNAGECYCSY